MRRRTIVLGAVVLVLSGWLGYLLIHHLLLTHSSAEEWLPARSVPNTDVNPYGANFFLAREVEPWKRQRTVEMAAEAGLGWAKQQFPWAEIEPLRKGEFLDPVTLQSSWLKFDEIVELYREHGLQVIARLDLAPAWARPPDSRPETPPTNLDDFGDFVYAFVEHFSGRVQYIQIWNEPNIYPEWGEQAVDPVAYTRMLQVAYQRAKEADPDVYVLSAPLAATLGEAHPEPGKWRSMPEVQYLEAMYRAGAGDAFDILSANAFGFELPPDDPPDVDVLNFRRVELQRAVMERFGDQDKAVWFNEYGWNAAPSTFAEEDLPWKRVDEERQAEYTLLGIEYARKEWPWAGVLNVWYFRQTGQQYRPDEAAYYFRMVDVDFTPRRMYDAVQDATRSLFVATGGHFEETHPAVQADASWRSLIAREASSRALLESDEPESSLTLTFRGHSVDVIARRDPHAGRLLVTLDGRRVDGLPVDEQGRSYLDLRATEIEWRARLPVATGMTPGQHVLRLTVDETAQIASNVDAFEVNAGRPPAFPFPLAAGVGAGVLFFAAALVWDLRQRPRRERFF